LAILSSVIVPIYLTRKIAAFSDWNEWDAKELGKYRPLKKATCFKAYYRIILYGWEAYFVLDYIQAALIQLMKHKCAGGQ
jgi:hypothetical protein